MKSWGFTKGMWFDYNNFENAYMQMCDESV